MANACANMYECSVENSCDTIVEVIKACSDAECDLVCCGQQMTKVEAKTADATTEKHVPVVEKVDGGIKVTVGSVPHPMEEKHYIEWIEVRTEDKLYRQILKPGMAPEAIFPIDADCVCALEHCNVHGLWQG